MLRVKENTAAVVSAGTGLGGHKVQPFDFYIREKLRPWWGRMGLSSRGGGAHLGTANLVLFQGALPGLEGLGSRVPERAAW